MKKEEFLRKLQSLLSDISPSEREEALAYYRSYFEEAGIENEEKVLKELENPEKVAKTIKIGLEEDGNTTGEFTERGYDDGTKVKDGEVEPYKKSRVNNSNILLVLILCIFAAPFLLPIAAAVISVLVAIICVIFVLFLGVAIVGIALLISGGAILGTGFLQILISPVSATLFLGAGLILLGIGLIVTLLGIWIIKKSVPSVIRGIVSILSYPFKRIRSFLYTLKSKGN